MTKKYLKNSGKSWTQKDLSKLGDLAKKNTPTRVIGLILGRSPAAIYKKASEEDISLSPTNRSPYGSKK